MWQHKQQTHKQAQLHCSAENGTRYKTEQTNETTLKCIWAPPQESPPGSYFDSDDMTCLLEPDFEDLPTRPAADLPLTDQVCHFCWIPLW